MRRYPFRLHTLPFRHPTMLAPMEGFSHATFRAILAEKGGVGAVCTEFVRITRGKVSPKLVQDAVIKIPGVPLSVQVMGNDLERMAEAAEVVEAAGADIVDINLGCPTPRAVRGGVGAAMLKDLDLLKKVLEAMRARVKVHLSAKIRAGFNDTEQVLDIADCIQDAGADYLVIHARKRSDHFGGVADWRSIRAVKEHLRIPVVGNGDCWYAADALRMREETGCDGVMVGRPALRNPWILQQIADLQAGREPVHPSGADLCDYLEDVATRFGPLFGTNESGLLAKLKELLRFVGRSLPDNRDFLHAGLRTSSVDAFLRHARDTLASMPPDRLDLDTGGKHRLEHSGTAL